MTRNGSSFCSKHLHTVLWNDHKEDDYYEKEKRIRVNNGFFINVINRIYLVYFVTNQIP